MSSNRDRIDAFLASGARANVPKKGDVRIQAAGKRVALSLAGKLTPDGEYYASKAPLDMWVRNKGTLERPWGTYAFHKQRGWLRVRTKEKQAFGWDAVVSPYGQDFYRQHQESYTALIPAIVYNRNRGHVETATKRLVPLEPGGNGLAEMIALPASLNPAWSQ
jgi:hypothetical protein